LTFVYLLYRPAPYGRHARAGFGPDVPFAVGWSVMEGTSVVGFAIWFALGGRFDAPAILFLCVWQAHYVHRALVDAWLRRRTARAIPLSVVGSAVLFNLLNAYFVAGGLFWHTPHDAALLPSQIQIGMGLALFAAGFTVNVWADRTLRRLRASTNTGYSIPRGGLYEFVSCPNYLGEIVEWTGFAIMTGGAPGAIAFAIWTFANLGPRARAHHAWYRARFPDYPRSRRALLPFVW
jgi:hypothetical protein